MQTQFLLGLIFQFVQLFSWHKVGMMTSKLWSYSEKGHFSFWKIMPISSKNFHIVDENDTFYFCYPGISVRVQPLKFIFQLSYTFFSCVFFSLWWVECWAPKRSVLITAPRTCAYDLIFKKALYRCNYVKGFKSQTSWIIQVGPNLNVSL